MTHVTVIENPFDPRAAQQFTLTKGFTIHDFLQERYPVFPSTCRIYRDHVSQSHDVTPHDEASAALLGSFDKLYVVVYPAWAQIAAAALVYAVAWVVTQVTSEKAAVPRERSFSTGSPSNSLSDRENRARLHERIPDNFGVRRVVPDLIMWTYVQYENHRAVEYSLMVVGRGAHSVNDIREGDTPIAQIADASVAVYPPGHAPGGGTPQLIIGDSIPDPAYSVYPVRSINGQDIPPFSSFYCYGTGLNIERVQQFNKYVDMGFIRLTASTGLILAPHNGDPDFVHSRIRIGDHLQVIFGVLPAGLGPIPDLSAGFYSGADPTGFTPGVGIPPVRTDKEPLVVTNVVTRFDTLGQTTAVEVHVNIPASLQAEWAKITAYSAFTDIPTGQKIVSNKNSIIAPQNRWLLGYDETDLADPASGGIFIDDADSTEVWLNFVAPRGLYAEDGANRKVLNEVVQWRLTPADADGNPTGDPAEQGTVALNGSMIGGEQRAVTLKITRVTPGRALLQVARQTNRIRQVDLEPDVTVFFRTTTFSLQFFSDPTLDPFPETAFLGSITDDIKLTECYSMSIPANPIGVPVTSIHSRIVANQSATRIERRQLNCRAFRSTGTWNGSIWQPLVIDTQGFVENMLFEAMLDPFIGNRLLSEIDFASIANASLAVRTYFGDEDASRFSYTFDDQNTSFEETILMMCRACFLTPYRQANVLKCDPDIATDSSVVLFNHRNKKPGTETRTETFGMLNDNDGAEQEYVNPDTGIDIVSPISQFLSQADVVSPLKSRIVGLRFRTQAWWHAYRTLARITHQNVAVEFDAYNEAGLVGLNQRILVADNTNPDIQDGECVGVSGLVIRTSRKVVAAPSSTYTVFLQGQNGNVESLIANPGVPDGNSITLGGVPAQPIIVDPNIAIPTTYILVRDQDTAPVAMLVTDKSAQNRPEYSLQAVNYSHMYYHADGLTLYIIPSTEIGNEEFFDRSPYERPNLADNTMLGSDPVLGPTYNSIVGFLTNSNFAAHLVAYSKSCWVKKDGAGSTATILSTGVGVSATEFFGINAANQLVAGHNGIDHCVGAIVPSVTVWSHHVVTYDSVSATMCIYTNGEMTDIATSIPTRTLSALEAFRSDRHGALVGNAKYLRHYCRALTPSMVRELYQKELLLP